MPEPTPSISPAPVCLALRREATAEALSISLKLLDELTADGTLPHVRIGKRVILYPIASLQGWLENEAKKGGRQ